MRPGARLRLTTAAQAALALLPLVVACEGRQNALDPAGPQAGREATLGWYLIGAGTVATLIIFAALAAAVARGRRRRLVEGMASVDEERRTTRTIVISTGITALVLLGTLVASYVTGDAMTGVTDKRPLTIEVTGKQWWWQVTYADTNAHLRFETANEIHIPVGRQVVLLFTAADVIHSFWVPNLAGKRDLIPGRVSTLWIKADRPGIWRGQCAEFCGAQHAKMGLFVIADPPDRFNAWLAEQRKSAALPLDSVTRRGQEVFLTNSCVTCHNISGTPAGSHVGPDLTHLASRRFIAAATLPNTRGHLAGWVVDPQSIKPFAKMPSNQLTPQDLQALLTYLGSLK